MQRGTTIVELTVAVAILAVVFAAIVPVFAAIRNHAEAAGASAGMVQHARVLNEQLYRHLAQARRITAASASMETGGYLEFETGDRAMRRCQLGSSGYIEFGFVGDLCELAGPVEYLKFTCYDGNDPVAQTDVAEHVRLVTWDARPDSAGALTDDKTICGACYLRINGNTGSEEVNTTYDFAAGRQGVDCSAFIGAGKPQVPRTLDRPASPLTWGQYDAIEVQDGTFHEIDATAEADYVQTRFVFQIGQKGSDLARIAATWTGKGVNEHPSRADGASLYLWNYVTVGYELLQTSPQTEAEITLSGSRTDTPAHYVGGAGKDTSQQADACLKGTP